MRTKYSVKKMAAFREVPHSKAMARVLSTMRFHINWWLLMRGEMSDDRGVEGGDGGEEDTGGGESSWLWSLCGKGVTRGDLGKGANFDIFLVLWFCVCTDM